MSKKTPQEQLEKFRASKPEFLVHILDGFPSSADFDALLKSEYIHDHQLYRQHSEEYESILKRIPHGVRDRDRRQVQEVTRVLVAPSPQGRPRKDALAREICDLRAAKWKWKQIANSLNEKYGRETTSEEAARKLFAASQTRPRSPRRTPEEQLAEFEVSYPDWLIHIFRMEYSYSKSDSDPDSDLNSGSDFDRWRKSEFADLRVLKSVQDEYEHILKQIPAKWREYQKNKKRRIRSIFMSPPRVGRPRKDEEAERLREMLRKMTLQEVAKTIMKDDPAFAKTGGRPRLLLLKKEQDRIRKLVSRLPTPDEIHR